jgi:hypothetical protein
MTDSEQLRRFGEAVEQKKRDAKAASERPVQRDTPGHEIEEEQPSRVESGRPQDVKSIRDKNAGKGKKTADKWNQ